MKRQKQETNIQEIPRNKSIFDLCCNQETDFRFYLWSVCWVVQESAKIASFFFSFLLHSACRDTKLRTNHAISSFALFLFFENTCLQNSQSRNIIELKEYIKTTESCLRSRTVPHLQSKVPTLTSRNRILSWFPVRKILWLWTIGYWTFDVKKINTPNFSLKWNFVRQNAQFKLAIRARS